MTPVRGYHQLLAVLRTRKEALGMSDKDLEHIAGLTAGHWSKIVAGSKTLGPLSFGRVLRALCLELVPREDQDAATKIGELYLRRAESQVRKPAMHNAAVHVCVTRRFLKRIGQIGGSNSRKFIGKRRARRLARTAARARWRRPKLQDITTSKRRVK